MIVSRTLSSMTVRSARNARAFGRVRLIPRAVTTTTVPTQTELKINVRPSVEEAKSAESIPTVMKALGSVGRIFRPSLKPSTPAQPFTPLPATTDAELQAIVAELAANAPKWGSLPMKQKAQMLRDCLPHFGEVAIPCAEALVRHKGSYGFGLGEELVLWKPTADFVRQMAESLDCLAEGKNAPLEGVRSMTAADGRTIQHVAQVFPRGAEHQQFPGFIGEIYVQPGKPLGQGTELRANHMRTEGGVSLVLGAGNQMIVVATDIVHKLAFDNEVVVVKMNPVNEYLGPFLAKAFKPFVDAGFLRFAYGGASVGSTLAYHPKVTSVHLTGSGSTFDALVWGPENPNKVGEPKLQKPIGAELGCVTPYVIVGGDWTQEELEYHAKQVVSGATQNAGHNCLTTEIVMTCKDWPQREAFMNALRKVLAETPNRVNWYPGSDSRYNAFRERFPDAEAFACNPTPVLGTKPWLLKAGLSIDAAQTDRENWCGVLQEVTIEARDAQGRYDPALYMKRVAETCNNKIFGSLSMSVFVKPDTQAQYKDAFEQMLKELKYGGICVNSISALVFGVTAGLWGAYPGNPLNNIGSGNCFVHNPLSVDHPEKCVVQVPWIVYPYPGWLPDHRMREELALGLVKMDLQGDSSALTTLLSAALRG